LQIPKEAFFKRKLSIILRILLMAGCSAAFLALGLIYFDSELAHWSLALITGALVVSALWVATWRTPLDRTLQLSPTIKIPAPLILRGLDTAREPIEYWKHQELYGEEIAFTTRSRIGSIKRGWFTDEQWNELLDHLPQNSPLGKGTEAEGLRSCFVVLFALCAGLHWLGNPLEVFAAANRLIMGAYNPNLTFSGDLYRSLSYSFLHINDLHIIANWSAFFLVATALRKGYSNFSLVALMGSTAILSVIVGTHLSVFEIAVGTSGVVMGAAGFLVTAQYNNDSRLHPINRVTQHKYLYLYLAFEIAISITYKSYGGMVHIAGFLAGSGYYLLFEKEALSESIKAGRKKYQWAINLIVAALTLQWAVATYQNYRMPYQFVDQLVHSDNPVLTMVGALATPDNPIATTDQVLTAKMRALANEEAIDYNSVAVARADFWLGNNKQALSRVRKDSIRHGDDDFVISLWLTVEQANLEAPGKLLPNNHLPAGTGTAYILSEQGDYLARFRLGSQPQDLSRKISRPKYRRWRLIGITDSIPAKAEGIWPLKSNQFLTRKSASTANP